nr:MAG TPA: hypothetical protein [Caudoviricetes sp.]
MYSPIAAPTSANAAYARYKFIPTIYPLNVP